MSTFSDLDRRKRLGYVVVINPTGPISLRHIIDMYEPYEEATFKKWYYSIYHELEGDEFHYYTSREEMLDFVEVVKQHDY